MVKKNLVLLGMMASGKTTLAKIVSKKHNMKFIDTDNNIVKKNSMSIDEIFKSKGEAFFWKEEEKEVLQSLKNKNCIISVGGGAFLNKNIRENILKNAISIWLDVETEVLKKRLKKNNKRPLLDKENNQKQIEEIYNKRKKIYEMSNHKIKCTLLTKNKIVDKIIKIYEKE